MKCYLVRHGQADMSEHNTKIYRGFGADLAPLSIEGMRTIKETRRDERLEGADVVVSSPYTRALQSAAMISRVIDAPLVVETDLHEWLPNKDYAEVDDEATYQAYVEYCDTKDVTPKGRIGRGRTSSICGRGSLRPLANTPISTKLWSFRTAWPSTRSRASCFPTGGSWSTIRTRITRQEEIMQYEIKPLIREEAEELDNKFYEYHDRMAEVRDCAPDNEDFVLKIVDEGGNIIAGLVGEICNWEQMEINTLWVDERYRRQGLGSLLLCEAERRAKQKGCYLSILGSLSFEGHGFYKKHGYTVYKDVEGWPRGCANYSLFKRLDEDQPQRVPTHSAEDRYKVLDGSEEDGEFIDEGLDAYEQSYVPDAHDYVKLNRKVVDADGHILAGIIAGVTGWDGCFIHTLWVEEPYRKQGLGRALVEQVEREAKENGAYMMLTFTFDWSVGFLRKCGYEDAGTLYDHPKGHSMTCFRKLL